MKFLPFLILALISFGCTQEPTSDSIQNAQQEQLSKQAVQSVGPPAITNFQEKRILKMVLELRDSEKLPTYTYLVDLNGNLHLLCRSVGYGIPYATQYTSPQKDIYYGTTSSAHMAMPQADPNGLFSPAAADGTWVLCSNPETKGISPVYIEPHIVVSPFNMLAAK